MLNDKQDVAMLWRQKQGEEQVLDEVLTASLAIQETYPEMSSAIWKKHETLFIIYLCSICRCQQISVSFIF